MKTIFRLLTVAFLIASVTEVRNATVNKRIIFFILAVFYFLFRS